MSQTIVLEEVIDGKQLTLDLPDDAPQGPVRITIEAIDPMSEMSEAEIDAELEAAIALIAKYPNGQGLTAEEIAKSPEIGMWAHRTDIGDSVEFVARMREENRRRRANRE